MGIGGKPKFPGGASKLAPTCSVIPAFTAAALTGSGELLTMPSVQAREIRDVDGRSQMSNLDTVPVIGGFRNLGLATKLAVTMLWDLIDFRNPVWAKKMTIG